MLGMKEKHIIVQEDWCEPLFIHLEEGTGENLWEEDEEQGFVDYIMYTIHAVYVDCHDFVLKEDDGGCVLCEKMVSDMTDEEFINTVLDFVFGYNAEGEPLRPHYEVIEE